MIKNTYPLHKCTPMATATADTTPATAIATATIVPVVMPSSFTSVSSTSVYPDSYEGDCKETLITPNIEDLTMTQTKLKYTAIY